MTLGLEVGRGSGVPAPRLVEVAVDAAGAAGARTYTYLVPDALADLEPGEAVLVEFGRRQALGIVLGETAAAPTGVLPKPIVERVRADGPLLPPLGLRLARWIAAHYLAPPALVLRAMLPPGMLERLELVAELAPGDVGRDGLGKVELDLLDQLAAGPKPARDLAAPEGRAGLVRRLRELAGRGAISLDWTLLAASAGPRYERWISLTPEGREASSSLAAGGRVAGRPLGPRQIAVLSELAGTPPAGVRLRGRERCPERTWQGATAPRGSPAWSGVASSPRRSVSVRDAPWRVDRPVGAGVDRPRPT